MRSRRFWAVLLTAFLGQCWGYPVTDTLLILHTNDLHDHIRSGYDGVGGMAYVSGYIRSVKASRPDTLLLDGGDVMEKGDMAAFRTKSAIMYEAMGRIGYDAGAIGNHDIAYGLEHLAACEALAPDFVLLCLNILGDDGQPLFAPSKIFDVDGVRVGVIGVTVKKTSNMLDLEESGKALAKEAARLENEANLLVVVCHLGVDDCTRLSTLAPAIDVFVGGHTHAVLKQPVRVEETGALIVQAGQYGNYVGRLELTIDLDSEELTNIDGRLVMLTHEATPCDVDMLAWIRQQEQEVCPEASRVVGRLEKVLSNDAAGRLAAFALRDYANADIGFCLAGKVIRGGIPQGPIDVNALFRTGGQRGKTIVTTTLSGAEIEGYMKRLMTSSAGQTEWAGFQARIRNSASAEKRTLETNLEPARPYRVALPQMEYASKLKDFLDEQAKSQSDWEQALQPPRDTTVCSFTFTEAMAAYIEKLTAHGISIDAHAKELLAVQRLDTIAAAVP